jgi:hypothetical protein
LKRFLERGVERNEVGDSDQFQRPTGRRTLGHDAEPGIGTRLVVRCDQNTHSRRRKELDIGQVNDDTPWFPGKGGPQNFFELGRGQQVDYARSGHDGHVIDRVLAHHTRRCRRGDCAVGRCFAFFVQGPSSLYGRIRWMRGGAVLVLAQASG